MKLNRNLNLVMKLEDDKGEFVTHTVPLPTELYSANFRVLRTAYEDMTDGGIKSAINLATVILKDAASTHRRDNEIRELLTELANATTVIRGKSILLNHSDLDDDVKEEVMNRLVFFIVWEYFVLPTEKTAFLEATSSVLSIEKSGLTVSEILSSNTIQSDSSTMTLTENEPTISLEQSHPI